MGGNISRPINSTRPMVVAEAAAVVVVSFLAVFKGKKAAAGRNKHKQASRGRLILAWFKNKPRNWSDLTCVDLSFSELT